MEMAESSPGLLAHSPAQDGLALQLMVLGYTTVKPPSSKPEVPGPVKAQLPVSLQLSWLLCWALLGVGLSSAACPSLAGTGAKGFPEDK